MLGVDSPTPESQSLAIFGLQRGGRHVSRADLDRVEDVDAVLDEVWNKTAAGPARVIPDLGMRP